MRKKIVCLFYIVLFSYVFAQDFSGFVNLSFDDSIVIKESSTAKFFRAYNNEKYFIFQFFYATYEGDSISMTVASVINEEKSKLITKLVKNKMMKIETISNIDEIEDLWNKSNFIYSANNLVVTEYIRARGNEWSSDDFGFLVKNNNDSAEIVMSDIRFNNIYSTYIEKGGYISPWNKKKVLGFENQNNPGIQFYYLVEKSFCEIKPGEKKIVVNAVLNDGNVRLREKGSLDSDVVAVLQKSDLVKILDCSDSFPIEGDNFPWVKVQTKNNQIGFVYGKYLDVSSEID